MVFVVVYRVHKYTTQLYYNNTAAIALSNNIPTPQLISNKLY